MDIVVIDTNIFVSALMNGSSAPREILRLALLGEIMPLMGNALLAEYEDVIRRDRITGLCILNETERQELLNAFLSTCEWTSVYFLWRPNLRDEADNHLIEIALAGGADTIITANKRDFKNGELGFPELEILSAGEYLAKRRQRHGNFDYPTS